MSEPALHLTPSLTCAELPPTGSPERRLPLWDRAGIVLSAVCLAHCFALPLLATALPLLTERVTHGPWFHGLVLALALPLALVAFTGGYRAHRSTLPGLLGAGGMTLLVLGLSVAAGQGAEVVLAVAGGLLLAGAHGVNHRLSRHGHHGSPQGRPSR